MNEFKVWLLHTGKVDGTPRQQRMWGYLIAPPEARDGFNPHAHEGAARRADLKLDKDFEIKDWFDFISTRTIGGLLKGIGSLAGYRSAFTDAWTQAVAERRAERPHGMVESIKTYFTGLAKKDAEERLQGIRKQKVGKDALPYEAFRCVTAAHGQRNPHTMRLLDRPAPASAIVPDGLCDHAPRLGTSAAGC